MIPAGPNVNYQCERLANNEEGQGRFCSVCVKVESCQLELNSTQHDSPSSTHSSTSRYKVTSIRNLGRTCAGCSLFHSKKNDNTLVVIPAIEDEEFFKHLEEFTLLMEDTIITNVEKYTELINDWLIENLEKEIEKYLTERKEQEKLRLKNTKYKYVIKNGLAWFEPRIEDPELKAYMDNFMMNDHFLEAEDHLDDEEIIAWVEKVLNDYQASRS